jgi:FkbM family methyltransferase
LYTFRRLLYYLRSLFTLLTGVRNRGALVSVLRGRGPALLELSDGSRYHVKTLMDAWIVKETVLDRDYERHGVPLRDGWTVLDVGAASGDFTVFAARRTPKGRVIAFEPAPDSVETMRKNVAENGLRNVEVRPVAVGAQTGVIMLDVSGGVAVRYRTAGVREVGPGRFAVQCVPLAQVLAELPGGRVDFLKIDVEGAEYEMLFGLDDAALEQIRRVCMEYHEGVTQYGHADLERFFRGKGWTVRISPSAVRRELGFLYAESPSA